MLAPHMAPADTVCPVVLIAGSGLKSKQLPAANAMDLRLFA